MKTLSNDEITATKTALTAESGNMVKAATALGITRQALHQRIQAHPACWPDEVTRKRYGTLRGVEESVIDKALGEAGGVVYKAAKTLNVSPPTLRTWVKARTEKLGVATVAIPTEAPQPEAPQVETTA